MTSLLFLTSFTEVFSIALVLALIFLAFRILEGTWSYRISKPFAWEEAVRTGTVSADVKRMERSYRDKVRFYTLWLQVQRLEQDGIQGAFAEIGVYKGATARILHAIAPNRRLHLFDTFEGFPERDIKEDAIAEENQTVDFSNTSMEEVRDFVQGNDNVIFHPGYFPETTTGMDELFAFVHLDADLYQPTLSALKYFYPRLARHGVIIIHDYNHNWSGVTKALDEFLPSISERIVAVADWQGSGVIIKS